LESSRTCSVRHAGIIRNKQKIMATITNAEEFQRIIRDFGSFQKWLDGLDKSNNYKVVIGRLKSRFSRVVLESLLVVQSISRYLVDVKVVEGFQEIWPLVGYHDPV